MARILVTGYGGFLGRSICRQLVAAGYHVRGIARRHYSDLASSGVETIVGDVTNLQDCHIAVNRMDGIIHTAAIAGVWGPRTTFESINVDATDHLLQASIQHTVKAFVYCSSPSVTFDGKAQTNVDESAPYPTRWLCDYPRTKAIAESRILDANGKAGMLTCALRPHLIWGEGDPHLIPRLISRCQSGRLRRVGDGLNLIDTVHVDSAAQAHCLAIDALLRGKNEASGRAFFITDGDPIGCWDWICKILVGAGLEPPKKQISPRAAYLLGHAFELAYKTFGLTGEPPMTRFVALQLGVDHYFSIQAARDILGYQPIRDRDVEFAKITDWLQTLVE
ncbi:MAG: NAD-dependent epimerase/dehydratase family protein [Pirellulaceae bacterium]|nr:NAD-dependent epimerase/dehydratase family protein [Pirellulaceae bacterium]